MGVPVSAAFAAVFGMVMLLVIKRWPVPVVYITLAWTCLLGLAVVVVHYVASKDDPGAIKITTIWFIVAVAVAVAVYFIFRKHIPTCGKMMGVAATALKSCPGVLGMGIVCMLLYLVQAAALYLAALATF